MNVRRPNGVDRRLVLGSIVAAAGALWLLLAIAVLMGFDDWGTDFAAYRAAAVRLSEGASLYTQASLEAPFVPGAEGLFLYPPAASVLFLPAVGLELEQGVLLFALVKATAIALACLLMPVRLPIRLVSIAIAGLSLAVLRDIQVANVSTLLLLPTVLAWRWLDRPAGSMALAVAMMVRASFGVFLVWQALRRAWRPLLWTIAAACVAVACTLPFLGPDAYADYLTVLSNVSVTAEVKTSDLAATARAFGIDESAVWMANLLSWSIAIGAVLLGLRRDAEVGFMVTLVASVLLGPLTWEHYPALLLVPAAFAAARGRRWALLLPLLTWLPRELLVSASFVALAVCLTVPAPGDLEPAAPAPAPGS